MTNVITDQMAQKTFPKSVRVRALGGLRAFALILYL